MRSEVGQTKQARLILVFKIFFFSCELTDGWQPSFLGLDEAKLLFIQMLFLLLRWKVSANEKGSYTDMHAFAKCSKSEKDGTCQIPDEYRRTISDVHPPQ